MARGMGRTVNAAVSFEGKTFHVFVIDPTDAEEECKGNVINRGLYSCPFAKKKKKKKKTPF
jgi:hypothetical protein